MLILNSELKDIANHITSLVDPDDITKLAPDRVVLDKYIGNKKISFCVSNTTTVHCLITWEEHGCTKSEEVHIPPYNKHAIAYAMAGL